MLLLGIDLGTSSVKVSVVDANSQVCIASARFPERETATVSLKPGWAEQSPEMWWDHVQKAILKLQEDLVYNSLDIGAIGISYQMHGLVMVDRNHKVLRDSIIWSDNRAVHIGKLALEAIGKEKCLKQLLNAPGNFTSSKLAWVRQYEPEIYEKTFKIMLPGDFIAMKLTGEITTSIAALSEGVFWDFQQNELSKELFDYYWLDISLIPNIKQVFEEHGTLTTEVANKLSLREGIPVSYKAGDHPNNALSLNVMQPGEIAATAGTSGVIYAVSEQLIFDQGGRINSFAHVNHQPQRHRIGLLLCINGTGILNRWVRDIAGTHLNYQQMNEAARQIHPGSNGLMVFPFGNGAERMLHNKTPGASVQNIDLSLHTPLHLYRATQEGIAFAFRYGLDIMRQNGLYANIIRAGKANMFLSGIFTESFVNTLNVSLEMYNNEGSIGAAIGAGIGAGIYKSEQEAFTHIKPIQSLEPDCHKIYNEHYAKWKEQLEHLLKQ
ncbi:MAG TPA: FGGY family carbohydrate kinase [Sediminibacterium sp.]|nr:FGGY family carbohydrate kinase [Sediminibacterium sp.]